MDARLGYQKHDVQGKQTTNNHYALILLCIVVSLGHNVGGFALYLMTQIPIKLSLN